MPYKIAKPMRHKDKLIYDSSFPVLTSIALNFIEKSNWRIKENTRERSKNFHTLAAAANEGIKYATIRSVVENSIKDAMYATAGQIATHDEAEQFLKSNLISAYIDKSSL